MSTPLTITHNFVSGKPDSGDETLVNPSNWNDVHVFNNLPEDATLYFDGTGNWSAPSGSGGGSSLFTTPIDIDVDTGTSTQGTAIRINSVSGGAGCGAGILWTDNADVLQMGLISGQDDDNWGGRLVFQTSPQTDSSPGGTLTERMRIDSSGHVGINTETPTGILHVNASQHNTGVSTFIITESQYDATIFSIQSKGRAVLNAIDDYSGAGPALTITQNGSNAGSALTVIQNGNGGSAGPALVVEQNNFSKPAMTISGGNGSTIDSPASGTALTINATEGITGLALTKNGTNNIMTTAQSYNAGSVSGSSSFTLSSYGLNAGISLTDGAGAGMSATAGSFSSSLDGADVTGDSLTGVSTSVTNNGTGSANNFYAYNAATPTLGTFSGIAAAYEADAGWPFLLYCTDTSAQVLIGALGGGGSTQMVVADTNGQLGVQAIPSGDISLGNIIEAGEIVLGTNTNTIGGNSYLNWDLTTGLSSTGQGNSSRGIFAGATGFSGTIIGGDFDVSLESSSDSNIGIGVRIQSFTLGTNGNITGVQISSSVGGGQSVGNVYGVNVLPLANPHAMPPSGFSLTGTAAAFAVGSGWPYLLYCTDTSAQVLIGALSGGGTQMVVADNTGQLGVQAIPSVPVTGLTAGSGISLSDSSGNFTVSTTTPVIQNIGASSSITIDWSQGQVAICNMNGDLNLDFFNAVPGVTYTVVMVQANGNDVNWSGNFKGASQIGSIYGSGNAHTKAIQQFICIDGSGSIYATAPATYNM